mmetsp:Transcript_31894/g.47414  ORF Transcript_31894/g.47414 Transcript_31894/m.47414 type:complete len:203 (+) Transcript_31894:37-645(+)
MRRPSERGTGHDRDRLSHTHPCDRGECNDPFRNKHRLTFSSKRSTFVHIDSRRNSNVQDNGPHHRDLPIEVSLPFPNHYMANHKVDFQNKHPFRHIQSSEVDCHCSRIPTRPHLHKTCLLLYQDVPLFVSRLVVPPKWHFSDSFLAIDTHLSRPNFANRIVLKWQVLQANNHLHEPRHQFDVPPRSCPNPIVLWNVRPYNHR